jgi:hypothetical protein
VEIACGQDHQRLDRLVNHDFLRRHPDPSKMRNIMCGIVGAVIFLEPALKALLPPGKFHRHILLFKRG